VEKKWEQENEVEACQSEPSRSRVSERREKCKRARRGVFMGNDREWEAECAGEA